MLIRKVRPHCLWSQDSLKQENKIIDWILIMSLFKNMHFQYKFGGGGFTIRSSSAINLCYWKVPIDVVKCIAIKIIK